MFNEGQVPKQYPGNIADMLDHNKLLQNAQQARGGANFPHANLLKGREFKLLEKSLIFIKNLWVYQVSQNNRTH